MVVDDDPAMCEFLRTFLRERGYVAITLDSAEEAVKRYHVERPAAVILDVVMPGNMDGLGALAAFKKIDREVPVIVLSGQGRTTTVVVRPCPDNTITGTSRSIFLKAASASRPFIAPGMTTSRITAAGRSSW